jgi:putative transposase
MGRKRTHTPEEIVAKLRQVEVLTAQGKAVAEAARSIGVTEQTFYRWRAEFGGLKLDQVKRLKQLEAENARLRRAVSDLCTARGWWDTWLQPMRREPRLKAGPAGWRWAA